MNTQGSRGGARRSTKRRIDANESIDGNQGRDKVLFVVHSAQIAYHRLALLHDALEVAAQVARIGKARPVFRQRIGRSGETPASAELTLARVEAQNHKLMALPGAIRKKLEGTP